MSMVFLHLGIVIFQELAHQYKLEAASEHFEPPAEHKGNVARAIFYFSVRYKMKVTPTQEAFLKRVA